MLRKFFDSHVIHLQRQFFHPHTFAGFFLSFLPQISLAIGFLFLGGGMRTFSTSNSSIAALLITLYPRLPTGPNDNRCHLQVIAND